MKNFLPSNLKRYLSKELKISSEGKNQLYFGDSDSKIDIIWKNEINFNNEISLLL